jgi:hypothetical protein
MTWRNCNCPIRVRKRPSRQVEKMETAAELVDRLRLCLANDFQGKLLDASLLSAQATENPLRLNNFSASFRELVRHVLAELAPDSEISASSWFVPDTTSKTGITRGHKIAYVIHGGLDPAYVTNELHIDIEAERTDLLDAVDRLNKFTHVNQTTFASAAEDVNAHVIHACNSLLTFLNCADKARRALCAKVEERVHEDVVSEAIGDTILSIDEISSHHSIEDVSVEAVEVTSIDHEEIRFLAHGYLDVGLQWGSNSDVRRGDGALLEDSFPLTCEFVSKVSNPEELEMVEDTLCVDTSSWWDGYYDE